MEGDAGPLYHADDDPLLIQDANGQWWTVGWANGRRVKRTA
jgi:hypothetical protein